ncbi:MAG: hypothetical protein WDM79_15695 [Terricaulis sp.]
MRGFLIGLCILGLAACARPAASGPEQVVAEIYEATAQNIETGATPLDAIPMSEDLATSLARAATVAQARGEPFLDGDIAANCQDCTGLTNLETVVTTPPADGHAVVEARFRLHDQPRVVVWDMIETPEGWRVNNIASPDGYDLRASIAEALAPVPDSCASERDAAAVSLLVEQCKQVSPATHPPCNADNTCAMIEGEIARACGLLGADAPDFCPAR